MRHNIRLFAILLGAGMLLPVTAPAANKEHEAIQRDIAMIGEETRRLQASLTNEFTAIKTMVQQSINAAQNSVLVLETRMTERMQSLEKSLAQTVANLNAKVDTMADEFRGIKEESKETNARLLKISTKLDDLKTQVQLQQQQAPPPPVAANTDPPVTTPPQPGPQAAVNGAKLFDDAERDRLAGKVDLSIKEYREFVKAYPKSERSCEAQFRVGELLMRKDDIPNAAAEFDMVIERYDSTCTFQPAARYMKGKAFVKAGQPTAAKDEFRRLAEDYKGTEWERKAKEELKILGFSAAAPKPTGPAAKGAKKLRR
jgi:TolA-binding protein